jgi:hypothetical protein
MSNLAFDTYAAVSRLKAVAFTEDQAKEIVDTMRGADTTALASKDDIRLLKEDIGELKKDIDGLKSDINVRFDKQASEFTLQFEKMNGEFNARLEKMSGEFNARFEKHTVEIALIKWMMGFMMTGIVALLVKTFFPH